MIENFTKHPHQVGETYGEHLGAAAGFGATLIAAGIACVIHAVFPSCSRRPPATASPACMGACR
uniref:Capsule biosynthesis protein n=1 Tax=Phenylobacterium glaciei TaxID=2803784 RepID=A0A974P5U7_9CAUL|nr:hypothetical protein JKL49_07040 [Phenylobacterium glaciei]